MSAGEVLGAFHRDAPYLFLGAAFVAVGLVQNGDSPSEVILVEPK